MDEECNLKEKETAEIIFKEITATTGARRAHCLVTKTIIFRVNGNAGKTCSTTTYSGKCGHAVNL